MPYALFRDALKRERKCAERFEQSFVLLLVEPSEPIFAAEQIVRVVTETLGGTAIVGWFVDQSVLGAIVPDTTRGSDVEALLREQLTRCLGADLAGMAVSSHVYFASTPTTPESELLTEPRIDFRQAAYFGLKRTLDVAGSLTLLAILAPLLVLIATVLKLTSKGPVLFRQARIGRMAQPFTMLKFRTMRVDADSSLHRQFVTTFIRGNGPAGATESNKNFKITNDPRVTPLGRFLRKTSLDELPQLLNVLRGDMSLVGPRPPLAYEVEQYRPWHRRRVLDAPPGVTGAWQVYGRSRTTFDEMVRLDIRYLRTRSIWNDVKILLATPRAVISGTGAQ